MTTTIREVFLRFDFGLKRYAVRVSRTNEIQALQVFRHVWSEAKGGSWHALPRTAKNVHNYAYHVCNIFADQYDWRSVKGTDCSFDYNATRNEFVGDPDYGQIGDADTWALAQEARKLQNAADTVKAANERLGRVGLPTYSELVRALRAAQQTIDATDFYVNPANDFKVQDRLKAANLDLAAEVRQDIIRRTAKSV